MQGPCRRRPGSVEASFVLSPEDAKNEEFTHEFSPAGEALLESQNTQVNVVPQMDQCPMKARERGLAEDLMVKFASRAYPLSANR